MSASADRLYFPSPTVLWKDMLQSFRGTIDAGGIRCLRVEPDHEYRVFPAAGIEFWAVLHDQEVPAIRDSLRSGNRLRAYQLLCERALSLGSVLPEKR